MIESEEMKAATGELNAYGIKWTTEQAGSGHIKIIWRATPEKPIRVVVVASTGSDRRGRLNARSVVRQYLRQDNVLKPEPAPKPKSTFDKIFVVPTQTVSIPEQIEQLKALGEVMREHLDDLTKMTLAIYDAVDTIREAVQGRTEQPPEVTPKTHDRRNIVEHVRHTPEATEVIARRAEITKKQAYQKLQYLKTKKLVTLSNGMWRLTK